MLHGNIYQALIKIVDESTGIVAPNQGKRTWNFGIADKINMIILFLSIRISPKRMTGNCFNSPVNRNYDVFVSIITTSS